LSTYSPDVGRRSLVVPASTSLQVSPVVKAVRTGPDDLEQRQMVVTVVVGGRRDLGDLGLGY
jgi:hypothetical protein